MSIGVEQRPAGFAFEATEPSDDFKSLVKGCSDNLEAVLAHDDLLALPLENQVWHKLYARCATAGISTERAFETMRDLVNVAAAHALTDAIFESSESRPELSQKLGTIPLDAEAKKGLFYKISVPLLEAEYAENLDESQKCRTAYEAVFKEAPVIQPAEPIENSPNKSPEYVYSQTPEQLLQTLRTPTNKSKPDARSFSNGRRISHLGLAIAVSAGALIQTDSIGKTSGSQLDTTKASPSSSLSRLVSNTEINAALAAQPNQTPRSVPAGLIRKIMQPEPKLNTETSTKNLKALQRALEALPTPLTINPSPRAVAASEEFTAIANLFQVANTALVNEAVKLNKPAAEIDLVRAQAATSDALLRHYDALPKPLIKEISAPQTMAAFAMQEVILSGIEGSLSPELTEQAEVATALHTSLMKVVLPSEEAILARVNEARERVESEAPEATPVTPPGVETPPVQTPPVKPAPPVKRPAVKPPVTPPAEAKPGASQTPEQIAADKAFVGRVVDLYNQVKDDKWPNGKPVEPMDPIKLAKIINDTAAKYNHPAFGRKAALAQLFRESKLDNDAGSRAGAQGIAQFMPGTWEGLGKGGNVHDPVAAIDAQFRYMIGIYDKMKGYNPTLSPDKLLRLTFAGYNSGPNLDVYKRGQLPEIAETQEYVRVIFEIMKKTSEAVDATRETLAIPEAPAGTRDLGIHDGSKLGKPAKVRLVAIPGVPSSSSESQPGTDYYVDGANGELIVNAEIAANILQLITDAKKAGFNVSVTSSFRTFQHQTDLFNGANGDTKKVGRPGHSLHESGTAIDWVLDGYSNSVVNFPTRSGKWGEKVASVEDPRVAPKSDFWKWLMENAPKYGMWQYYNEPWHWDPTREAEAKQAAEASGANKQKESSTPAVADKPKSQEKPGEPKKDDKAKDKSDDKAEETNGSDRDQPETGQSADEAKEKDKEKDKDKSGLIDLVGSIFD